MIAMGLKADLLLYNLSHINLICLKLEVHWKEAPTYSIYTSFYHYSYHYKSINNIFKQKRDLDHGVSKPGS